VATFVLAAMLVLPATASSGPTRLSDPNVSPSSGTTATTFVFTVKYQNHSGSAPDHVSVVIDGASHLMSTTATSWKRPVEFTYSLKLRVGKHSVSFASLDRDKFADSIPGGSVTVTAPPAPTPEATPKPTARPTPRPTPHPEPTPAPSPRSTPKPTPEAGPGATATPTSGLGGSSGSPDETSGGSTPSASASDDPATAWNDGLLPGLGGTDGSSGGPTGPDGANPGSGTDAGEPGAISAGTAGGVDTDGLGTGGSSRGWGTLTAFTELLGLDPVTPPPLRFLPTLVGTTGAVAMAMAFGFFGKRRRDGDPPASDDVLAAAAARGSGLAGSSALVHDGAVVPPQPLEPDAEMPRWRRPSLLHARKADPLRNAVALAPLSFDHGLVGPLEGHERRLIRYTTVTLLDAPDELRSAAIGSVAKDDEVQLLKKSGTYWLVLCPDGRQGWLHRMTLGDVVGDEPSPTASKTWGTDGSAVEDVDDDVLTAFLRARSHS
jgi:hypothetical protein